MSFPRHRFLEAGVSTEETDRLQQHFDLLPPAVQAAQAAAYATLASADLGEIADAQRQEAAEETVVEPVKSESSPATTTSTATTVTVKGDDQGGSASTSTSL